MPGLVLPDGVLGMATRNEEWAGWVHGLTALAEGLLEEWQLTMDGLPMHGYCSLVLPVTTLEGERAVLKLTWPGDEESQHEHLALQRWHGDGAVRLLRADPLRRALLLERLSTDDLRPEVDIEACEVVGALYGRIHVPALPQLHTLTSYVDRWATQLGTLPRDAPIPRRMVEQTISLAGDFVSDPASVGTMIHGDLHYENVLAANREPWLVIDPKPMSGDPHYEPAAMLWNRFDELDRDVRAGTRRRFHALVDAGDLVEERARDWVVVRMILNAAWHLDDVADGMPLDQDWVTMCVAIAKAVQD
jgi:streptomycin 6-kinase